VKSSISQIKNSLRDKKISVEELYDEFLIKAKSSKTNSLGNFVFEGGKCV
jgi:hypothetical protein